MADTEFAQPIRAVVERIDDFEYDEALERLNLLREAVNASTADIAILD